MDSKNHKKILMGVGVFVVLMIFISGSVLYVTNQRVKHSAKMLQQAEAILTPGVSVPPENYGNGDYYIKFK